MSVLRERIHTFVSVSLQKFAIELVQMSPTCIHPRRPHESRTGVRRHDISSPTRQGLLIRISFMLKCYMMNNLPMTCHPAIHRGKKICVLEWFPAFISQWVNVKSMQQRICLLPLNILPVLRSAREEKIYRLESYGWSWVNGIEICHVQTKEWSGKCAMTQGNIDIPSDDPCFTFNHHRQLEMLTAEEEFLGRDYIVSRFWAWL